VTWAWRPEAPPEAHAQPGMGIVAQEVEAVFPELVETRPDGFKQVDYDGLIAPLLKAVAELRARLALLENREGSTMDAEGDRAGERVSRAAQAAAGTSLDVERLERVFPALVQVDEHGNKSIAYHGLVAPLIEAVKELDVRLAALEAAHARSAADD
jgi:hypothetical protein